jgi:hypothetical protein
MVAAHDKSLSSAVDPNAPNEESAHRYPRGPDRRSPAANIWGLPTGKALQSSWYSCSSTRFSGPLARSTYRQISGYRRAGRVDLDYRTIPERLRNCEGLPSCWQ